MRAEGAECAARAVAKLCFCEVRAAAAAFGNVATCTALMKLLSEKRRHVDEVKAALCAP
jgi:hypothetical protein